MFCGVGSCGSTQALTVPLETPPRKPASPPEIGKRPNWVGRECSAAAAEVSSAVWFGKSRLFRHRRFSFRSEVCHTQRRIPPSWLVGSHLFLKVHERGFSSLLLNGFLGRSVDWESFHGKRRLYVREKRQLIFQCVDSLNNEIRSVIMRYFRVQPKPDWGAV